jgi:hypothetical protein
MTHHILVEIIEQTTMPFSCIYYTQHVVKSPLVSTVNAIAWNLHDPPNVKVQDQVWDPMSSYKHGEKP